MRSVRALLSRSALGAILVASILCLPAPAQNITSNLAAHWKMDESSGTSAADSSGNNRTGTVFGTANWQSGLIGNTTYLNGATYVRATGLMGNPANVTVAAWVNLSAADSSGAEVISIGDYFILRLDEGGTTAKAIVYTGSSNWTAASYSKSYPGTGWHHFAAVFSDTSNYVRLYIDGAQVASTTVYGSISYYGLGSNTYIGKHGNGQTTFDLTGKVDDARVYSRALSSGDIAALYTNGWATKSLMFVHNNTTLTSQEVLRRDKVMEWGYQVTLVQDSSSQSTYDSALADADVVYVSEEASSTDVSYKLRQATVGVVNEEAALDDEFGVSTSGGSESTGTAVNVTDNSHYITNIFSTGSLTITSSSQPLTYTNATRASGLSTLGTVGGTAALGVIETGGSLANSYNSSSVAFGRRVVLPIGGGTFDFSALNSNGLNLLKRALEWAATPAGTTTGLVGQWKLSESSGTTAADSSGNGNNGTYTNGVTLGATGPFSCSNDDAADFDGVNDYVSIANENQFDITTGITVAAWFKVDTFTKSYQTLVAKGNSAWRIQRNNSTNQLQVVCSGLSTTTVTCTTNVNDGNWHHVAGTFNGSALAIYIDGTLETTVNVTGTISTNNYNVAIGENLESTSRQWDGKIQDVRVYNYALSSSQIWGLAKSTAGLWAFSEGTGTTAADTSGSGNNATLSGGATWTSDCSGNKALLTNGTGGIAVTASTFSPPDEGTIAFWLKSTGPLATQGRVFGISNSWEVRQQTNGTLVFDLCTASGVNSISSAALNVADTWYHVAVTYCVSDDTFAIYIDGQLDASGIESSGLTSQPAGVLSFGTRTGSTDYWPGALRDFRVYNRRLCPNEIAKLYGLMGRWKLVETSGTTAADSSQLGNNGTYTNGVSLASSATTPNTGDVAAKFDGSDDYVSIANEPDYNLTGPMTVTAWIRADSLSGTYREFVTKGGGAWRLGYRPNISQLSFQCTGLTTNEVLSSGSLLPNRWYHVAGVYTGSELQLYINGVLNNSVSTSGSISTNNYAVNIGRNAEQSGREFNGAIYDARVYNRALCPTKIAELYGSAFTGVKIIKWEEIQ